MSLFKSKKVSQVRDSVVCPACTRGKICGQKCDYCGGSGWVTPQMAHDFRVKIQRPAPEYFGEVDLPKRNLRRGG
jgi:hypothetical protein